MILLSLSVNKSFSQTKDSRMNRDVARNVAQPEKNKTPVEGTLDEVVTRETPNGKCILQFAILAERIRWFLFNHLVINQFIAAIVINRADNNIKNY
jgi:hypothetical protein